MNNYYKIKIDNFFNILKKLSKIHPFLTVFVLHEYYRSLYPLDKYIPFKINDPITRFRKLIHDLTNFCSYSLSIGSYWSSKNKFSFKISDEIKVRTGKVYGPLWKNFLKKDNLQAIKLIKNRLPNAKKIFKDKLVLDAGCGGGRYTNAILTFGAKKVVGVDYGVQGLSIARKNYKKKKLFFKKENVLKLSFKDNTFDVVFSNGVLHHTQNVKKGISELVRVCKEGGSIWLYLYSKGGIFWYSRKLMNKLMKNIPYNYSQNVLDLIGLPQNRFIFMDNWYVPIENHLGHDEIIKYLNSLGVTKIKKIYTKIPTDFENALIKYKNSSQMWGEGEIRFLIQK
jgi:ubiquinone/menaquinone biosynthesis C-methylase UbiE